ncbi:hypothetical protein BD410DRAFT_754403 [Rickenella mellea]|uniref:Uncharacterized protein n=1 Tax=Rickenella mellea TaxID=50990 RepID=A0A4Y7PSK7_9AGAM|nr:hypothetical protein BD410DRAFT_754403 [Rickenella mellea]
MSLDDTNPVLYANRAACSLQLKKFLDAASDAKKATELDPCYPKGWGRLAAAYQEIDSWVAAIMAWQRAIAALPIENLTAGELKQKEQYEKGLKEAVMRQRKRQDEIDNGKEFHYIKERDYVGKKPADRARAMYPELRDKGMEGFASSGWVLYHANNEFTRGLETMNKGYAFKGANGEMLYQARTGVLDSFTNAIMRDKRVFYINNPKFLETYNLQLMSEAKTHGAWTEGGPVLIMEEAQERLRQKGWKAVRAALGITVRSWIMRAFFAAGITKDYGASVEWYTNAIDLLDRGRMVWRNVSQENRGVIFSNTFVRGVRSLRLESYLQAYSEDRGPNSKYPLTTLLEMAQEIAEDCLSDSPSRTVEYDPGFISSFYVYPWAEALAMIGYVKKEMAYFPGITEEDRFEYLSVASTSYVEAAKKLPDDDELHCWYAKIALEIYWELKSPLYATMAAANMVAESYPKMMRIWEHSSLAMGGRDKALAPALEYQRDMWPLIRNGALDIRDAILPPKHFYASDSKSEA